MDFAVIVRSYVNAAKAVKTVRIFVLNVRNNAPHARMNSVLPAISAENVPTIFTARIAVSAVIARKFVRTAELFAEIVQRAFARIAASARDASMNSVRTAVFAENVQIQCASNVITAATVWKLSAMTAASIVPTARYYALSAENVKTALKSAMIVKSARTAVRKVRRTSVVATEFAPKARNG